MGYIYRWAICEGCGKRQRVKHREKPGPCPKCDGESFRTRPNWFIRFKAFGRKIDEKVGSAELALKALKEREADIARGRFRLTKEKNILFREFVLGDYWDLYAKTQLADSTRRDYWNRLQQRVLPEFGEMYINRIERADITRWIAKMKMEIGGSTINRFIMLMRSIYRAAHEIEGITHNPVKDIKPFKEDNARTRYLTPDEYRKLIDAAGNDLLKAAIALAVGTMLRRSNLFSLRWSYIDLKSRTITIPASQAKGKKKITLRIIQPVYETLAGLPRALHSDYVLFKPRTGGKYRDMRTAFERAVEKAGIEDITWHGLRHTGASWLVMSGVDLNTVQELMGLNSIKMVQRYAHLAPEHKQKEAEKMSRLFDARGDIGGTFQNGKK